MILIDASMLFRRCYSRMDFLKNSHGVPTGMEFGTLKTVESLQKHYPNQVVTFCFDSPTATLTLQKICPEYKANRQPVTDKNYWTRVKVFKQFLKNFYHTVEKLDVEADELLYSLAYYEPGPHYIYTNDSDMLQCVNDRRQVKVVKSFMSKLYEWDEAKVQQEYNVTPDLLPLFRAFTGDGSDNLIGVPRINKRYLAELLMWAKHANLETGSGHMILLEEIITAEGWSDKMREAIREFITSGKWHINFRLMRLVPQPVALQRPRLDESFVIERLKYWEIRTLKICETFKESLAGNLKDEEF